MRFANPPYGAELDGPARAYFRRNFVTARHKSESDVHFAERALILAERGDGASYIPTEFWLKLEGCAPLRNAVADATAIRGLAGMR